MSMTKSLMILRCKGLCKPAAMKMWPQMRPKIWAAALAASKTGKTFVSIHRGSLDGDGPNKQSV